MHNTLTPAIQEEFEKAFGAQFVTSLSVREHHARDESAYDKTLPDAVIFARSVDDVVKAVKLCHTYSIPVVAFGAGTSIEGHILPIHGGITLDLSEMNKVLSVDDQDFTVTVEPGVLRHQLNEEIRHTGLYFPIDPGANASIGGMVSTRASGTTAVKYGTMRENVLSLKVVTANGELIRTSSRAAKSSAGYDLTRLFIGSEGTLGIVVEITLKVYPVPEEIIAAVCAFPTLEDAVNCTVMIRQSGTNIGRVEFLDANAIKAVNQYSHLNLKELPTLFFEFHGSSTGIQEQITLIKELAQECGGADFEWASKTEERSRLWTARHNAYFASLQLRPNSRSITTDVCVPISALAQCVSETAEDLKTIHFPWTMLGHVGDGNFHVLMMIDPHNDEERAQAEALNHRLVQRAIAMDGTCTGEHGIGIHKMEFLKEELGLPVVDMMRQVKHALDPKNILNPGKIFTWE